MPASEHNPAHTSHPVHELIARRWSPRAFADRPVDGETLSALFEAARWAPSGGNQQPWVFIVGRRHAEPAAFEALASTLDEGNAVWATRAPVLVLTVARLVREPSGKPNGHAWHDLGMATYALMMEATARGLFVHPMGGFDAAKARTVCAIPEDHAPVAMLALGEYGDAARLPPEVQAKESAPRARKPIERFVHEGVFGAPATFVPTVLP